MIDENSRNILGKLKENEKREILKIWDKYTFDGDNKNCGEILNTMSEEDQIKHYELLNKAYRRYLKIECIKNRN